MHSMPRNREVNMSDMDDRITMPIEPSTQQIPMLCKECDHEWSQTMVVGVAISVFTGFLATIRCPNCGNAKGYALLTGRKSKKGK